MKRLLLTFFALVFALVFALSIPFWWIGGVSDLQLITGLSMSMLMPFCPMIGARVLTAPIAYKPPDQASFAAQLPCRVLHLPCNQHIQCVPTTPPELQEHASPGERARVTAILDRVPPVSPRTEALHSDSALCKHLSVSLLSTLRMQKLIFRARHDRYGTYASAQYAVRSGADSGRKIHRFRARRAHLGWA